MQYFKTGLGHGPLRMLERPHHGIDHQFMMLRRNRKQRREAVRVRRLQQLEEREACAEQPKIEKETTRDLV